MFVCLKSSNVEGNAGRSASVLMSVQNILLVISFYKKYIVTIREFHL